MSGAKVWDAFQAGDIDGIRNYCETDVVNTYLVYLRFEMLRGQLSEDDFHRECEIVREALQHEGKAHLQEFLDAWL